MSDTTYSEKRLQHAEHNESACDYLNASDDFLDWVVTTAFYSALHFVEHKLFPRTEKVKGQVVKYETFDDWYKAVGIDNKHSELRQLVQYTCPGYVSSSYRALLDSSYSARYRHYATSRALADKAKRDLDNVKAHCTAA